MNNTNVKIDRRYFLWRSTVDGR